MMELCAGRVNGTVLAALVNRIPSDANRSMLGVATLSDP